MSSDYSKIALFIDGANLYATAKALGFEIDYKRLLKEFQGRGTLVRAFYYTVVIEDQENVAIRPLIDWLDYFSGDGDFRALVEAMQRCGVLVNVVSTASTQPPMIADALRRQADHFTDLIELKPLIARGLPN